MNTTKVIPTFENQDNNTRESLLSQFLTNLKEIIFISLLVLLGLHQYGFMKNELLPMH